MDKTSVLINLIKSVITGVEPEVIPAEQMEQVFALAQRHDVLPMVADGLYRQKDRLDGALTERCQNAMFTALMRYERMQYEMEKTCQLLEQAQLPFIPLKGAVLRKHYPQPWMRTSCDVDILVKDVDRAAAVLAENGYINKGKGSHDIIFVSPGGVTIEMHFLLIETDKRVDAVLQNVWEYAQPAEPGSACHILRDDMFYFYHIAHMAKHFSMAGCGVRFFVDTWLLNGIEHDRVAREKLLAEGGLSAFEDYARKLSLAWFGEGQMDPMLEQMEHFVFQSGTLGSDSNQVRVHKARSTGKSGFLLYRIFMPYSGMRLKYPILKNWPVLLPVYWVRRWGELLFQTSKRKHALQEMKMNQKLDSQSIRDVKWMLDELEL